MSSSMIVLVSSVGETLKMEKAVAMESQLLRTMIEDDIANGSLSLPNVSGKILIEFCNKKVESAEEEHKSFRSDFVQAANYLHIENLLDLICETVADMMKGKKPVEIRKMFNIVKDYTPEEEEEVRRDNAWAFEEGE